jgi:purine-binding chemotaxis protein CheW
MDHLFLIATIAGTEIAISSDCIESVVTVGEIVDVPQSDPLIAGLIALRSRVLTLIDCQYAVTGKRHSGESSRLAVIATILGHPYALRVEAVKDVVSVRPEAIKPPSRLDPRWLRIVSHVIEVENSMVMQLDPEMLLMPQTAMAA